MLASLHHFSGGSSRSSLTPGLQGDNVLLATDLYCIAFEAAKQHGTKAAFVRSCAIHTSLDARVSEPSPRGCVLDALAEVNCEDVLYDMDRQVVCLVPHPKDVADATEGLGKDPTPCRARLEYMDGGDLHGLIEREREAGPISVHVTVSQCPLQPRAHSYTRDSVRAGPASMLIFLVESWPPLGAHFSPLPK